MKHLNLAIVMMAVLFLSGCAVFQQSEKVCQLERDLTEKVADKFVAGFECDAPDVVQTDVFEFVNSKLNVCKEETGPKGIGSTVCSILVDKGVEAWGTKPLPAEWKCKATTAKATVKLLLQSGCALIPFKPRQQ